MLIIFMVTAKIIVAQGMPMDLRRRPAVKFVQTVFSVELSTDGRLRGLQAGRQRRCHRRLAKEARTKTADLALSVAPTARSSMAA